MTNAEITRQAMRAAARRRSHGTLQSALAEYNQPSDEPCVLWRGKLALRDNAEEFDATIEAADGAAVFRSADRSRVDIESIDPAHWRRAVEEAM